MLLILIVLLLLVLILLDLERWIISRRRPKQDKLTVIQSEAADASEQ